MSKNGQFIYKDAVIVRSHNRRIVVRQHKRVRNGVLIEIYSVNPDKGILKGGNKHVLASEKRNRRITIFAISYEALRDLSLAIELYNLHVESIREDSVFYKQSK